MSTRFAYLLCLGLMLIVLPQFLNQASVYLLALIMVWAIACIGYDLVFGFSGLMSFGHAAFFGLGTYTLGVSIIHADLPFWLGLVLAGTLSGALAILFGLVALRARGVYFGLITLALAELMNILTTVKLRQYTGGTDGLAGIPRPSGLGLIDFTVDANYASFVGALLVIGVAAAALIRSSAFGQVLRASRQNEVRAEQLGWNVNRYRLAIFGVSGVYAGLAGALLASLMSFAGPDTSNWTTSGEILIMTVLGGRDILLGPLLGVAIFELLREVASSYTEHWSGLLGLVFIACTLYLPTGFAGLLRNLTMRARVR